MTTKYLDSSGLAYFWGKLKAKFQDKLVSGTNIKTVNNMSLLGNGNIDIIADDTIAFYRKVENVYTTQSANETTIPVGISGLRSIDMLLVNINGLDLAEGVDFNRSGTDIVLTTPISAIGQAVHFTALRAVSASAQDYSVLKGDDGVVQDVLQNGVSVLGQDGVARIVAETDVGTSTPTADTTAKFDNNAYMNSTDMSDSDVSDFVDGLNVGSGVYEEQTITALGKSWRFRRIGSIVFIDANNDMTGTVAAGNTNIGTLNESLRPKYNVYLKCTNANLDIRLLIYPSGQVTFYHPSQTTGAQNCGFSGYSWIAADV